MKILSSLIFFAIYFLSMSIEAEELVCGKGEPFYIGAGVHLGQNSIDSNRANIFLKFSGFNSFRDELYWNRIEKRKGAFEIPTNLSDLDKLIRNQPQPYRLTPLIALDYGNPLYDNGDIPRSTEAIQAFAAYSNFVAKNYDGIVPMFEIWNEWNGGMGSIKSPREKGSVDDYLKLIKVVAPAIRSASSKAKILAGATAHIDENWSTRFAQLGGLSLVDGFSIHPYNYNHPDMKRLPDDGIEELHALQISMANAAGLDLVPFYITEIGIPTHTGKFGSSEEEAAIYAMRFLLLARTKPYICGVWWYELIDSGSNPNNSEHRFGIFRQNGEPKPAAKAITKLIALLKDGHSFKESRQGNLHSVSWQSKNGNSYEAHWAITGSIIYRVSNSNFKRINIWPIDVENINELPPSTGDFFLKSMPILFQKLTP